MCVLRDMENTDIQHRKSKLGWHYERSHVTISNDESFAVLLLMNSWEEFELTSKGERVPRGERKPCLLIVML